MSQDAVTKNQIEVLNTPFLVDDIFTGKIKYVKKKNNQGVPDVTEEKEKSAKQSDTTVMPDLESEESAAEIKNQ